MRCLVRRRDERKALDDVERAEEKRPTFFHPYNKK
jgi:hypothetical protein